MQHFVPSRVTFVSSKEVAEFLAADRDGYVASLTPIDLYARDVATAAEYKDRIVKLPVDVDESKKKQITKLAQAVDQYLYQSNQHKLASVPWKIAFMKGDAYENGYPHTRGDVIFLSTNEIDSVALKPTLLHEKVHVYQRMYPDEMAKYIQSNKYRAMKLRKDEPMARSNPDLDDWIYVDPRTSKPMVALYTSQRPSSISDVVLQNAAYEHPYEKMAYEIAAQIDTKPSA